MWRCHVSAGGGEGYLSVVTFLDLSPASIRGTNHKYIRNALLREIETIGRQIRGGAAFLALTISNCDLSQLFTFR